MREIKTIEVDRYEPGEKPGTVKHVGMISPREAFESLKNHLESVGLLPDEYFNPDTFLWNDIKELPDYRRADCVVSWGGNEGIYLDISLLYRDENDQLQHFSLATGKTLGETGDDYLLMSRIAAECSMMLNGRGCLVRFNEEDKYIKANEKVFTKQEIHDFPYQVGDLVASYEEIYNIPENERVTLYFGDYGMHFFKDSFHNVTPEMISTAIHKALHVINMTLDEFIQRKDEFIARGNIVSYIQSKMSPSLEEENNSIHQNDLPENLIISASSLALDSDDIVNDEDELSDIISDYLSDTYGFCHRGFELKVVFNEFNEPSEFRVSNIDWDVDEIENNSLDNIIAEAEMQKSEDCSVKYEEIER